MPLAARTSGHIPGQAGRRREGDKAQRLVITDVRAGVLLRARECLRSGVRAETYVAAVEVLLPTSNP